jgi:putative DNA primase/helicase
MSTIAQPLGPLQAETMARAIDPGAICVGNEWRCASICHGGDGRNLCFRDGSSSILATCRSAGCTFREIMQAVRSATGLNTRTPSETYEAREERDNQQAASRSERIRKAVACFQLAQPIDGTLAETYLRARAIVSDMPDDLRFCSDGRFGGVPGTHPMMIGIARNGVTGSRQACHRTALQPDGTKAGFENPKRAIGPIGGAAIRLSEWQPGQQLIIGEGIESAMSAQDLARLKGVDCVAWAAISAPGMRTLELAAQYRDIILAADRGYAGEQAANAAASRYRSEGRNVRVVLPPERFSDFNDFAQARAALERAAA